MEGPLAYRMPAIAASGLMVYTGDKFPAWRNSAFVGAMRYGEIPNTGHLQRIVFNEKIEEIRREMLSDRDSVGDVRDVRQGRSSLPYDQLQSRPRLVDGAHLDVHETHRQGDLANDVFGDVGGHLG